MSTAQIKQKLYPAVSAVIILIILGAIFYHKVENWSWVESIYFTVSTLTTVGFGDLHPTHTISRIFTIFYMLFGISVMLYTVTLLGAYTVESGMYSKPLDIFRRKAHATMKTAREARLTEEIERLIEKLNAKTQELESEQQKNGKVPLRYRK